MLKFFLGSVLAMTAFTIVPAEARLPDGLTKECLDFIASLPKNVDYGFIQAPEDWDHPDHSPKIPVFYYTERLAALQASSIVPIAYYNGGPGSSSHSAYQFFKTDHEISLALLSFPPAKNVPFLYIDQRGTGCSGSLPNVPITLAGAERLGRYGTRNTVYDSEAIRAKLFPDGRKWKLFGQSYGTAIVHRYISLAPYAVEKAFAHGLSMMSEGFRWSEFRLISQQRVSTEYLKKFPADYELGRRIRSLIPKNYCVSSRSDATCGPAILDSILGPLGFTSAWDSVHATLLHLLTPAGELDLKFLESLVPSGFNDENSIPTLMNIAVTNREMPGGYLQAWSCAPAIADLKRHGEKTDDWFYNECRLVAATRGRYDRFVPQLIAKDFLTLESLERGLRKEPTLELHLYAGGLDSYSPLEGTIEVRRRLGKRIFFTNFSNTGHDWLFNPKIWEDLKR